MRRSTDRLTIRGLSPREREAVELIAAQPGITVAELQAELGVGKARVWQIVARLEAGRVHRAGDPPMRRGPASTAPARGRT